MQVLSELLSITEPSEVVLEIGYLVRLLRQRERLTIAELSRKSGVSVATISRLERKGLCGTEILLKVLFALGQLEILNDFLKERLRLAQFPKTLRDPTAMVVQRVRHKEVTL